MDQGGGCCRLGCVLRIMTTARSTVLIDPFLSASNFSAAATLFDSILSTAEHLSKLWSISQALLLFYQLSLLSSLNPLVISTLVHSLFTRSSFHLKKPPSLLVHKKQLLILQVSWGDAVFSPIFRLHFWFSFSCCFHHILQFLPPLRSWTSQSHP